MYLETQSVTIKYQRILLNSYWATINNANEWVELVEKSTGIKWRFLESFMDTVCLITDDKDAEGKTFEISIPTSDLKDRIKQC